MRYVNYIGVDYFRDETLIEASQAHFAHLLGEAAKQTEAWKRDAEWFKQAARPATP
jgi:hypothetical protein